jgi:hypothetical protein
MDKKNGNSKHLPARSRFGEDGRNSKFEKAEIASALPRNDSSVLSFRVKP